MIDFSQYTGNDLKQISSHDPDHKAAEEAAQKEGLQKTEGRHEGWLEITDAQGLLGVKGKKHYIEILTDSPEWGIRTRQFLHLGGDKRLSINAEHAKKFVGMYSAQKGIGHRTAMLIAKVLEFQTQASGERGAKMWQETASSGEIFRHSLRTPSTNNLSSFLENVKKTPSVPLSSDFMKRLSTMRLSIPSDWKEPYPTVTYESFVKSLKKCNQHKKSLSHLPKDGSTLSPEEALLLYDIAQNSFSKKAIQETFPKSSAMGSRDEQRAAIYKKRASIYEETLTVCDQGSYQVKGKTISIDSASMMQETESYGTLEKLSEPQTRYGTQFKVTERDTFEAAREYENPVVINFANRFKPGGGVEEGCPAQEEALCRRSNHMGGLWKIYKREQEQGYFPSMKGYFPDQGGVYCPHVTVFRENDLEGTFMDKPHETAIVAVAAYDLRSGSPDRETVGLPLTGDVPEMTNNTKFIDGTKEKIRNMLREMALKGHTHLVLGALGCGAFENPPQLIASLFREVFQEEEFRGRFESVDFAIYNPGYGNSQRNVDAFKPICDALTKNQPNPPP